MLWYHGKIKHFLTDFLKNFVSGGNGGVPGGPPRGGVVWQLCIHILDCTIRSVQRACLEARINCRGNIQYWSYRYFRFQCYYGLLNTQGIKTASVESIVS